MNSEQPSGDTDVDVDVCVVTWNTGDLTPRNLRDLLDSDQGCTIRILVHDNASEDGTPTALRSLVPEADVSAGSTNLGFARGVNALLERTSAPWVLLLNADAAPRPGAIGALLRAGREDPRCAAVAPRLLGPDGTVEHSVHPFPSCTVAACDALGGRRWLPRQVRDAWCLEGSWDHERPRTVDWAVGATLLLRREALESVGGLDERFFLYVEDLAWCWRAAHLGWTVRYEPHAEVVHVGNVSGRRRFGDARTALEERNLRVLLNGEWGAARTRAYTVLTSIALARRALGARAAGRRDLEAHWRERLASTLGLRRVPRTATSPVLDEMDGGSAPADGTPRVAVVVPTHNRSDRLARLVARLEAQDPPEGSFEVVIVDDSSTDGTREVLATLASSTKLTLRTELLATRRGPAAARNLGWRSTRAPIVAFTDDDCAPAPHWLVSGCREMYGSTGVVAGRTLPPADQAPLLDGFFSRTVDVTSARFFETCNVFYRRELLDAVGGFDERFRSPSGEDTHLAMAVTDLGAGTAFAEDAVVYHDVRPGVWRDAFKESLRWTDLPLVVKGKPERRSELLHRQIFWKPTHPPAILAAIGIAASLRWRPAVALTVPWLRLRLGGSRGGKVYERWRALPGALVIDLTETAVLAAGSLRHRTLVL